MLRKLFKPRAVVQNAAVPPGERIYAIGDIHGRLDLLEDLLIRIQTDNRKRAEAQTSLIFLGDLIDRGPQSAHVVERLRELGAQGAKARFLLGNHEEVFLLALGGNHEALRFFTRIGGKQTIFSYGISPDDYARYDYPELMDALRARVPESHLEFLNSFEDTIGIGDYLFVHAGVRPETSLNAQNTKDLRWIREEFLNFKGRLEKIIVHGHTISPDVEALPHRIGLDTGAYLSGKLSAMGFERDQRWLLQTTSD